MFNASGDFCGSYFTKIQHVLSKVAQRLTKTESFEIRLLNWCKDSIQMFKVLSDRIIIIYCDNCNSSGLLKVNNCIHMNNKSIFEVNGVMVIIALQFLIATKLSEDNCLDFSIDREPLPANA